MHPSDLAIRWRLPRGFWLCLAAILSAATPSIVADPEHLALRAGGGGGFAPYHFIDETGEPAGFDVDLLRAVAREAGWQLEIELGPWEASRRALERGELDLLVGAAYSPDRAASLRFTTPTLMLHYKTFVRRGEEPPPRSGLHFGRRYAIQREGVLDKQRETPPPGEGAPVLVDSARAGFELLLSGQVDAFATIEFRGLEVLRQLGHEEAIERVGEPILATPYGFASQVEEAELIHRLNAALAVLERTGEYDAIHRRWFGIYAPSPWSAKELRRLGLVVGLPLLGLFGAAAAWVVTLRRQVRSKTQGLREELARREQAEIALRESEERFSKAFRFSPELMVIARLPEGTILEVNDAFEFESGYGRTDAVGRTGRELGVWADPDDREKLMEELAQGVPIVNRETKMRTRTGELRDCLLSIAAIEVGAQPCALFMLTDVTESRRLEEELEQSRKMEAVGQLAGGIAHDFNNILTTIQGHGELALAAAGAGRDGRTHLEQILVASERAASLTGQMLAFSRRQILQPRVLDLGQSIAEMERMLSRVIGEHVRLQTQVAVGTGSVRIDPGQFNQMLVNLVVNARDAMPKGGDLVVRTRSVVLAEHELKGTDLAAGEYQQIEVVDEGVGIADSVLPHIFEPFYTTKGRGKGTGLGLATVYGVAKQSRGHIEVETEVGKGTVFRILLPTVEPVDAVSSVAAGTTAAMTGHETILVVEDEEPVRRLIERALRTQGYEVLSAPDPAAGVALSREHEGPIDLLITDVVMPGRSGSELAEQVRQERKGIGVLFISGYTDEELTASGLGLPRTDFLQKPFSIHTLAESVRAVLDGEADSVPESAG